MSSALEVQTFSWISHPYLTWLLNMEHSVCKVSLAHHTKEWLSALWSTWWLRAQRKQIPPQPTLDCLSQQMLFPSLSTCVLLKIPSASRFGKEQGMVGRFLGLTCLYIVCQGIEAGLSLVNDLEPICLVFCVTCKNDSALITSLNSWTHQDGQKKLKFGHIVGMLVSKTLKVMSWLVTS